MSELKFRAWHSGGKYPNEAEMFYDKPSSVFKWLDEGQPVTIMQYAGLKDKNGVEIYDGDIIKGKVNLGGNLKRFIGFVDVNLPSVTVQGVKQYSWKTCQSIFDVSNFEVVGNIYENPELIGEL